MAKNRNSEEIKLLEAGLGVLSGFNHLLVTLAVQMRLPAGTLYRLGTPEGQQTLLAATKAFLAVVAASMAPVQASIQFLDRTVSITMDLSKTMIQLIADGRYDWINSDITKKFIIQFESGGTRITEVHLLYYNKRMSSGEVLADMERQGLRAATFLELLWIGIQHGALQLEFPIVALGTVVELSGRRRVAYLGRNGRERDLGLDSFDSAGWLERDRFAAVPK